MTPNIFQRHSAVKTKLEELLSQARRRLHAERREGEKLCDYVTLRALARDVEAIISDCLDRLQVEEKSVSCAESLAELCHETLAIGPDKLQQSLRTGL
jgi:hypothetical protein